MFRFDSRAGLLLTTLVIFITENVEKWALFDHGGSVQHVSQDDSNTKVRIVVVSVHRPNGNFRSFAAYVANQSANTFNVCGKLFSDHGHQDLRPDDIHNFGSTSFLDRYEPSASIFVLRYLPHWDNSVSEDIVIRGWIESTGRLDGVVKGPKLADSVESVDVFEPVLPRLVPIIGEVPPRPAPLQFVDFVGRTVSGGSAGSSWSGWRLCSGWSL